MIKTCKLNGIIAIKEMIVQERFCITWTERSNVLVTRYMLGIEEDNDKAVFTRDDALPATGELDVAPS